MHLAKPVDPGELVASVATLARRGQSTRVRRSARGAADRAEPDEG
jgi:DNA-binding response OmpR family regulator